jgi:hypothetical protein
VDDVLIVCLGGEHDDGLVSIGIANLVADLESVHAGQHHIQQDHVVGAGQ